MMGFTRLTKEREDKQLKEVNYSREQLEKDLELLKDWLREQKHLPESRIKENDIFLINYLVGCKGSLDNAKKKLDGYYSLRGVSPVFQERDNVERLKMAGLCQFLWASKKPLPDDTIIYMIGARNADVEVYDPEICLRRVFLACEYLLRHAEITGGKQVLADATGFSAGHIMKTPLTYWRTILTFLREGYPVRLKKFIVFNAPPNVESMVNTFIRPLLSPKYQDRLIVTRENIDKVFPYVDDLPSTYGGKQGDILKLADEWENTLVTWDFLPNLDETVDEKARPVTDNDRVNPYFGLHGSIKTLVID